MNNLVDKYLLKQEKNEKKNYDLVMNQVLSEFKDKKSILVHSCCAVCSTVALEKLSEKAEVYIYFYNPNIHPKSEYKRRALAQKKLIDDFNSFFNRNVKYIVEDYKYSEFNSRVKGLEQYSERSQVRCKECYSLRFEVCAKKCKENNFDYWATALTLSPLKNAQVINKLGLEIAKINDTNFFVSDFKKNKGNIISKEMCEKFNVYRQCYCGCQFAYSEQDLDIKKQIAEAKIYLNENS